MQNQLSFVPLIEPLIPQVVDIHSHAFAGQMNVKLGRNYLYRFFKWFVNYPNSISVVAIESGNRVRGYVIGAPLGYDSVLNRELFWIAAGSLIIRPSLWFKQNIRNAVVSRAITLIRITQQKDQLPKLPLPTASLVGIGVEPQFQKGGIGIQLMQNFEEKSKTMQMRSMRLSVYPNNYQARRLYEKCGWSAFSTAVPTNRTMYYCKLVSSK